MADDFDALMSGMGVKRLGKKTATPPSKKAKSNVVRRKRAGVSTLPKATPQDAAVTLDRIEALERGLELARTQREESETKVKQLKKKIKRLKLEVDAANQAASEPHEPLVHVLSRWGYSTPEDRLVIASQDGWLERFLGTVVPSDLASLEADLRRQFLRVCSDCKAPAGKTALLSARAECTVCGGFDLSRETRKFLDAVLINGRLRVVIVGRDTENQREIRDHVVDSRLVLTQIPGSSRREVSQARTDVEHSDAVIIWDPSSVAPELLEVYRTAPIVGEIPAGPLGALLAGAAAIVGQQ